ncbi:MAG: hypothetical protein DWQ47_13980 [Acidobacteria bacterium]|nr:MAG: hypothetical protein DWQ32_01380 [Acidobacteriota bacterium]REK02821.1 MAG: hypothetical protein DWQ38_10755 [Acidobacteriota bacterium]REK13375.1 MAG: hypothetical protein DWQ43_07070 [Acidobacteriota bacterium]REK41369.1 MAG: hypothetical protein DWQ47_13980 [Acidobacteriota bacterium]
MEKADTNIPARYQQLIIMWIGLFNSQILFIVLIYFSKSELFSFDPPGPALGDNPPVTIAFAIIAITLVGASFVLKSIYYKRSVDAQDPELVKTGLIIAMALCEGASLLGVLSAFVFNYQYFFAFIALALAGMIFHFPMRSTLMNATHARKL